MDKCGQTATRSLTTCFYFKNFDVWPKKYKFLDLVFDWPFGETKVMMMGLSFKHMVFCLFFNNITFQMVNTIGQINSKV